MGYEWSPVSGVADPPPTAQVDILAAKPWGQTGEEAFQLTGSFQLSDLSGNRPALPELGALVETLRAGGWEQIQVTTVQEVTRTVIESEG